VDLRTGVIACFCLSACGDRASGDDVAPRARVSMRWPSTGDVVASTRPRVRWSLPPDVARTRVTFCADRRCARVIEDVETDGHAVQPTHPLPAGVVFWRAHEALDAGAAVPSGPTWWFVVPRVARDTAARASRDLAWTGMRDVDGDGRWDPLDVHGVVAAREGGQRVVRTRLVGGGTGPVTAVGDLDGDGYVDFAGADPLRNGGIGRVFVWRGPLGPGAVAPWREGNVGSAEASRCGAQPSSSGDFDGDGRRELVVSCPNALSGRGEVHVVALEGEGLGRTVRTIRASASGGRSTPGYADARMRALLAEDLDDDGCDDLVVGIDDARCEWVGANGSCRATSWIGVYLGGPGGLVERAPLVFSPVGDALQGASATVFESEDGVRRIVLGGGELAWLRVTATPALVVDTRVASRSEAEVASQLLALPQREGDDHLITSDGSGWFDVTRSADGSLSRRALEAPGRPWETVLSEVADVQGDGVPDVVVHAVGETPQRAVIFAWEADGSGRVDAVTRETP
jgi:FG-GAP-like repeat